MTESNSVRPRIIVALDYGTPDAALQLVERLTPGECRLKVGLELFTAGGPGFVRELVARGFSVFLDLKFHDIPNTVAQACARAAELGVWMINVHALGGRRMLEAARAAVAQTARPPLLVAVTVLTSHAPGELAEVGVGVSIPDEVSGLARLAADTGLGGVVCSPQEVAVLRSQRGPQFILVTPGIRPSGAPQDDQRRSLTPAEAVALGADYLVVGRPITRAPDPRAVLTELRREIGEV